MSGIGFQPVKMADSARPTPFWPSGMRLNVAAGFSLRLHRRDACATKDISINAVREIEAYATIMG